jgi:peptide/nickel transport system substrate-binding protein
MVDRVLNSKNYEAAIMNFASGDSDPTSEMNVWLSSGSTHLWNLTEAGSLSVWQAEIDRLMNLQLSTTNQEQRKNQYNRVQQLVALHVPMIFLASPHVLVAAGANIGNLRPGILYPYALWNIDELFVRADGSEVCR